MKTNSQKEKETSKGRKLKLNKQTIKDLRTDDKGAEKVKGGARGASDLTGICATCNNC
jgi:hypothetical protein